MFAFFSQSGTSPPPPEDKSKSIELTRPTGSNIGGPSRVYGDPLSLPEAKRLARYWNSLLAGQHFVVERSDTNRRHWQVRRANG